MQAESSVAEPAPDAASRILAAAFALLVERGYAHTSTLAIATRAGVSKRALYEKFGSKEGLVAALIGARTARMLEPPVPEVPRSRAALAATLRAFGTGVLTQLTRPTTLAIYRLAILEAERAPRLAHLLDERGRQPVFNALLVLLDGAAAAGVIPAGRTTHMQHAYLGVLLGEITTALLLGLRATPGADEILALAEAATEAAMALS
jgi:AcrR family transcriptional regulator